MKRFLKALSLVLSLAIFCLPLSAVADGGYGESVGNGQDTIDDETVSSYVVSSTDLENATGTMSNGTTTWGIHNSGEADHGMVYVIRKYVDWSAISNGNTGVKYTYDSKQYTLFDEPIEPDSYYILSYDYKSFPFVSEDPDVPGSKLYDGGRFSLAPSVSTYVNSAGTDWRDIPPASDNEWSRHTTIFYSDQKTALDAKINNVGTNTTSYIDNYKLVKALKLDVYNPGDTALDVDGTGLMYNDKYKGYFAEMGESLTIKAVSDDGYESIVEVTHGGEKVEAVNGAYTIDYVSGDISVKFGLNINEIEENAGVAMNGNTVYANVGDTYVKFLARFGMPKNVIKFFDAEGADLTDFLKPMANNMTAKVVYDGNELRNYNVKYKGDLTGDGELTVSDILSMVNGIVNDSFEDSVQADMNNSGRVTVSDIVKLRGNIMNQGKEVKQFKVLAIGNSFSIDATFYLATVAKAAGYDLSDIVVGNIYYSGCSLEQHMEHIKGNVQAYGFQYYKNSTTYTTSKSTLLNALQYEDWDFITIQQASKYSGKYNSFEPYGTELINYINENKLNPNAKIFWHMTWAYPQVPPEGYGAVSAFKDYDSDQMTMYNAIIDASTTFASTKTEIEKVLPVGTAIQNLRAKVGDVVTRDQFHLNQTYARLTAALTWFKVITGKDIDDVGKDSDVMAVVNNGVNDLAERGVTITADKLIEAVIKSVNDAVVTPSSITE